MSFRTVIRIMGRMAHPASKLWATPLLVLSLASCAGRPAAQSPEPAPPVSGNADEVATVALGTWASSDRGAPQALAQIGQAARLAPDQRDVAWLHLRLCTEVSNCESEPLEAQLRRLDPGNGIAWLGALARAQARRDVREQEHILEAMSRTERFDVYWTKSIVRLTKALTRIKGAQAASETPLTDALNDVTGWLAKLATPEFKSISTACDVDRIREAATRARCERIAQAMRRSDTTLAEGIGLGIGQRLTVPGSAAALTLEDRVATLRYQNRTAGTIMQAQLERDRFSAEFLELMQKLPREQDVSRAILRWAGEPLAPKTVGMR